MHGEGFAIALALTAWAGCGVEAPAPSVAAAPAPVTRPAPTPDPPSAAAPAALPGPADPKRFPAPFTIEPEAQLGTIEFVADGDTMRIALADRTVMVRLLGVNTPEKKSKYRDAEPWGARISDLARTAWLGKQVTLIADLNATDLYDRVLGYVALDGQDLGEWLLEHGYARVFEPQVHPRRSHYLKLLAIARHDAVGMWEAASAPVAGGGVIGNRLSKVMHAPGCDYLPAERNRVPLDSQAAAAKAGYRPHSCLPSRR